MARRTTGSNRTVRDSGERRRPGRPVGQTETRERIVEVAVETFAQHGFSSTSMRKIAGAADVTPPAVTHHFRSKEGLYVRVLEEIALSLEMWLFDDDAKPGAAEIVAFVDSYFAWLDAHPDYARIVAFELVGTPDFDNEDGSFLEPVLKRARGVFERAADAGEVPDGLDVEMYLLNVLGAALHFQPGGASGVLVGFEGSEAELRSRFRQAQLHEVRRLFGAT